MKYSNKSAYLRYCSFIENPEKFPISFDYGDTHYEGLKGDGFSLIENKKSTLGEVEKNEFVFLFKNTLKICVLSAFYHSHGAFEYSLTFENVPDATTENIKNIKTCTRFEGGHPVLKGIYGDLEKYYEPYEFDLSEKDVEFVSKTGRATHIYFPYFNLEYGDCGVMLAIGWAGTWSAGFKKEGDGTVYTANAVNGMDTYLKPGEKIRTALFVQAHYQIRDEFYATNYWRSWFVEHNLPKADKNGTPLTPFSTCCLANDTGLPNSDGSISERYDTWKPSIDKMIQEDCKVDFRWFDAGWYCAPDKSTVPSDWWGTVGTWELDPVKWPDGSFLESTEYARKNGMKTLMWFEPERVTFPDDLVKNFGYKREWAITQEGVRATSNNIGDPECFDWTVNRICKTLKENKVEMYREDNNCNPAELWDFLDGKEGEGRKGITELKFIDGHYRMWDKFIECTLSYGGCGFVDSCASGGGRNDLESMRRGVPLLRSDADRTTTALRLSMTTAFNKWIPFCGANTKEKAKQLALTGDSNTYIWRASYLASSNVDSQFVQDPDQDFSVLRNGLREWKKINKYLLKDFYVLTPWHSREEKDGFTAYCYYDEQDLSGYTFIFRMEECENDKYLLKLPFVKEDKKYMLTDEDTGENRSCEGKQLKDGINYILSEKKSSKLLFVKEQ